MDPIHQLNFTTDSTICLIKEAQRRGFLVYCYGPNQMFLSSGRVFAKCQSLKLSEKDYELDSPAIFCLEEFDVILMRQDPPFDMNYITSTYLLEKIHPRTLVVNNPSEVRNLPEKLFICNYPELMPATVVTQDVEIAVEFLSEYKQVVIKPLYAFGGKDVSLVNDEKQIRESFATLANHYNTALVVQKFLPEVKYGDKRIILLDGKAVGAVNRIPVTGSIKANLAAGANAYKTVITSHEQEICNIIGPELAKRGIIIAGIDVIGEYITEINVTCPTTFNAVNQLNKLQGDELIEARAWDSILSKIIPINQ